MSETTPPNYPYETVEPLSPKDERLWATLVHVGGIFLYFLPALIGYVVLKDRGAFIREHTATALNFQLTILIAGVVSGVLVVALIGLILLPAVGVLNIVFSIIAALAANKGEAYTYPYVIKFVS